MSGSYKIVDTNQNQYYGLSSVITTPAQGEAFYGQDAQYHGSAPNYQDNGNGTVTDLNTGLVWVQVPQANVSYADAVAGAGSFSLAGFDDWRLPTIKELYSLMDFSGYTAQSADTSNPYIDTTYFNFSYGDTDAGQRFIDAQYWSSTEYTSTTMRGDSTTFGVNFADGRIKGYPNGSVNGEESTNFVRYVRGNEQYGVNDFVNNGNGTVSDQATGLMWQQADSGESMSWQEALAWAESLEVGGYNDWRLPNAKELQSLVDYSRSPDATNSAAIDPLFSTTQLTEGALDYPYFWSSTTHVEGGTGDHAVYLAFGEARGYMQQQGQDEYDLLDVHGAGSQRSDPKSGDPADFPQGFGPQGDVISIYNYVRAVRDDSSATIYTGTEQNDLWLSSTANESFNGGEGIDRVTFNSPLSSYQLTVSGDSINITGPDGNDSLTSVERLQFDGEALGFDFDGSSGQAYRLYKAAFDREPDAFGLRYWIYQMDYGLSLFEAAQGFLDSDEFKSLYGDPISDQDFVTALYTNVLDREFDQAGLDWWLNELDQGLNTRAGVLAGFSESTENKENVLPLIENGIMYPYQLNDVLG